MSRATHVGWRAVAGDLKRALRWWVAPDGRRAHDARYRLCREPHDYFEFSRSFDRGAAQVEPEILAFLETAAATQPRRVCEIGTSFGGTTFMFCQLLPTATEVIGIDLFVRNRLRVRHYRRTGQRLYFIDGASAEPSTLRKVERLLGGNRLDVLFIDGDHNYAGVLADFLAYRHLVRDGGIIGFHDIQPDGRAEGIASEAWVGDVPELWGRLKEHYNARELIAWPDSQLGCGIGLIRYDADAPLPAGLEREEQPQG